MPSKDILAQKQQYVDQLVSEIKDAQSVVFSDYQGINVDEDTEMRKAIREQGGHYAVVKNSMAKRAFEQLGITGLDEVLTGPTAMSWSCEEVTLAPRVIKEHVAKFKKMKIKGGVVDGAVAPLNVIEEIASIPTTEVLHGQLVASLIFPIKALAMVLNSVAEKAQEQGLDQVADAVAAKAPAEEAKPAEEEATPAEATTEAAPEDSDQAE